MEVLLEILIADPPLPTYPQGFQMMFPPEADPPPLPLAMFGDLACGDECVTSMGYVAEGIRIPIAALSVPLPIDGVGIRDAQSSLALYSGLPWPPVDCPVLQTRRLAHLVGSGQP